MPEDQAKDSRRVVRLEDLTPDERRLVLALIDAAKAARERDEAAADRVRDAGTGEADADT